MNVFETIFQVKSSQFLTVDGTSDTVTLAPGTQAVYLYAIAACWVTSGFGTVTAVKPGAEKTSSKAFYVPAATLIGPVKVPVGTDASLTKVAAIQDSTGGALHITELG
jgi:hypothetical protein